MCERRAYVGRAVQLLFKIMEIALRMNPCVHTLLLVVLLWKGLAPKLKRFDLGLARHMNSRENTLYVGNPISRTPLSVSHVPLSNESQLMGGCPLWIHTIVKFCRREINMLELCNFTHAPGPSVPFLAKTFECLP